MSIQENFIKNSEHMLICTDLETDDLIGLEILSKSITNKKIAFLVGEGDATIIAFPICFGLLEVV